MILSASTDIDLLELETEELRGKSPKPSEFDLGVKPTNSNQVASESEHNHDLFKEEEVASEQNHDLARESSGFSVEDSDLKLDMMRVDDVDMADEWFDTFSGEELEFQQEALFDCSNSTADLDPTFKENEPIFKGAPITLAETSFSKKETKTDNVEDIYDGYQYKKLFKPGQFLYGQNNISLMWYTDGCPLFKSSKVSLWPLFFAINELPYKKRFLKENMIYAGLWVGEKACDGYIFEAIPQIFNAVKRRCFFQSTSPKATNNC
ncbi:hypothetical protein BSL78_19981 [Apostichopus japonicus]|uniref:Uncharacterized protein n=1 Tax=Stichopus japonicus TaxID=307972 RepID=A0A2G8K5F3_STIJA|nr:hypothetical protein BSL78_19981 [Apostichopus japonicus]